MQHHAEPVMAKANICPMVDQIEYHPGFTQKECVEFCQKNNILVEAWSPLGRGNVLDNPLLKSIAANHGKITQYSSFLTDAGISRYSALKSLSM